MAQKKDTTTQKRTGVLVVILAVISIFISHLHGRHNSEQQTQAFRKSIELRPAGSPTLQPVSSQPTSYETIAFEKVSILDASGGRVSWNKRTGAIAYDKEGNDDYFDVYIKDNEIASPVCITCDPSFGVPSLHNGQPAWHPSGDYLLFQAQDPGLKSPRQLPRTSKDFLASPGIGINNNLWLAKKDGSQFWQLTSVQPRMGVLHPHFSPDGTKLVWSEFINERKSPVGHLVIKLADFSFSNGDPVLGTVQTLRPDDLQLYETHGFSPDGNLLLYSGIAQEGYYYDMEIYTYDLTTGTSTRLTSNEEWDEHAHFTPDGKKIVWSSSQDIPQRKGMSKPKLDYWVMNLDGSDKRRLTNFNDSRFKFNSKSGFWGTAVADFDWSPDGRSIAAYMISERSDQANNYLLKIDFTF